MLQEEVNLENLKWLKTIDGAYKQFVDGAITGNECALRFLWYDCRNARTRRNNYLLRIAAWLIAVVVRNDNRYGW
jgi:hypothetical protein